MSEETKLDRSTWGPGPWDNEPDKLEWRAPSGVWRQAGLPCLIVRNNLGALCGYVAVPPGHPWHGMGSSRSSPREPSPARRREDGHICHVPVPGEDPDVWWLGFDCAHAGDRMPGMPSFVRSMDGGTYRTIEWVRAEVEQLAAQVRVAGRPAL